jgi:hypothetical protein
VRESLRKIPLIAKELYMGYKYCTELESLVSTAQHKVDMYICIYAYTHIPICIYPYTYICIYPYTHICIYEVLVLSMQLFLIFPILYVIGRILLFHVWKMRRTFWKLSKRYRGCISWFLLLSKKRMQTDYYTHRYIHI